MSRTALVLALSTVVLAACAPREVIDPEVACRNRILTLNHASDSIRISQGYVGMCGGYTLTVRIEPRVGPRSARSRTAPEGNPDPTAWLNATSTDGQAIVISVPAETFTAGDTFKYALEVDGVGLLDPTIGIIRR